MLAAAVLAGAGASQAHAMASPACAAAINPLTGTGACSFDTQWDYTLISVVPVGPVGVHIRCVTNYGYVTESSRTVTERTTFTRWTPGGCTMTLTGTAGAATATPMLPPIVDPPPPVTAVGRPLQSGGRTGISVRRSGVWCARHDHFAPRHACRDGRSGGRMRLRGRGAIG